MDGTKITKEVIDTFRDKYSYIIPAKVERKLRSKGLDPYDPRFTKLRKVILKPGTIIEHSKGKYRVHTDGSYRKYYEQHDTQQPNQGAT